MFKSIKAGMPRDSDFPARTFDIAVLRRVLNGELYDDLEHDFHAEKNGAGEYIPLRWRRPSVQTGICRTVVDDVVSLLFSEGHFPKINCSDENTKLALEKVITESHLNECMIEAALSGAVGSVVILMRVLSDRVFFSVMNTEYLTPEWLPEAPDTLANVTEQYKVKGRDLIAQGYPINQDDATVDFWFKRVWDADAETWFAPWKVQDEDAVPVVDAEKAVTHALGFVPMVWIKNLPGGNGIDGAPTLTNPAINTQIEADYLLSQGGRGLKYSADPLLLIKEPAVASDQIKRSAGNALLVSENGDAKLLEINGSAAAAVIDYARCLRETILESMHGNRSSADKISAAQSGRAMELMNQALIWLADKLRVSYGETALLDLLQMVVKVSAKFKLTDKRRRPLPALNQDAEISLRWPAWYAPTAADRQMLANALKEHTDGGHISLETATRVISADYAIEDVKAEAALAAKEVAARDALAKKAVNIPE